SLLLRGVGRTVALLRKTEGRGFGEVKIGDFTVGGCFVGFPDVNAPVSALKGRKLWDWKHMRIPTRVNILTVYLDVLEIHYRQNKQK
ncbi:MAG: hypothetical protein O7D30_06715, partial [Rickettsia endosymbiont of Ixodes persulcatus]|nr:hypothetical protein [Rickettsia endosymbiont of Ixodes persulcatus]